MKNSVFTLAFGLSILALTVAQKAPGQEGADQTWVWATPEPAMAGRHLSLEVSRSADDGAGQIIHFVGAVRSTLGYNNTRVVLDVLDSSGTVVSSGEQGLNVLAGATECRIVFDATALPLGTYEAQFRLSHPQLLDEPSQTVVLRKVNGAKLLELLVASRSRLDALEKALDNADGTDGSLPYLRLKASIAGDVLRKAEENGQKGEWESLEQRLHFVTLRLDAIHGGLVFGAAVPERLPAAANPALNATPTARSPATSAPSPMSATSSAPTKSRKKSKTKTQNFW